MKYLGTIAVLATADITGLFFLALNDSNWVNLVFVPILVIPNLIVIGSILASRKRRANEILSVLKAICLIILVLVDIALINGTFPFSLSGCTYFPFSPPGCGNVRVVTTQAISLYSSNDTLVFTLNNPAGSTSISPAQLNATRPISDFGSSKWNVSTILYSSLKCCNGWTRL